MNREEPRPLSEALLNIEDAPETHWLFAEGKLPWTVDARTIVLRTDAPGFDEGAVKCRGFRRVLSVPEVQDVVLNAKDQKPEASIQELLAALNWYHEHDGFMLLR